MLAPPKVATALSENINGVMPSQTVPTNPRSEILSTLIVTCSHIAVYNANSPIRYGVVDFRARGSDRITIA